MAVKLGKGKFEGINACANKAGVIAAAAIGPARIPGEVHREGPGRAGRCRMTW